MLGINIISKAGLLLFTHSFSTDFYEDIDADMHAGVLSAIFNVLRETQRESIKSIRQRDDYIYLLYEGVLTYGLSPSTEENPRYYDFLRDAVLKFELEYTKDIHLETVVKRSKFDAFHETIEKMYQDIIDIDVSTLNWFYRILAEIKITNYIIYERKYYFPVIKAIKDPELTLHADKISQVFRYLADFGDRINQEFRISEFIFDNIIVNAVETSSNCIVIFSTKELKERGVLKKQLAQLQKKITEKNK